MGDSDVERMVDDAMKLINLASKLQEDGGLAEILENEIGKNHLNDLLMEERSEINGGLMSLRVNFFNRYDGAADKLRDKLIDQKWNDIKEVVALKKKDKKVKVIQGQEEVWKKKKKNRYKKQSRRQKGKKSVVSYQSSGGNIFCIVEF